MTGNHYSGLTYSLACYRRLKRYLGESDAMTEVVELAIRHFLQLASADQGRFVQEQSERYGVRVNPSELSYVQRHFSEHCIGTVYGAFERFFEDLRDEHCAATGTQWPDREKGEDQLSWSLRSISIQTDPGLIGIANYYRLVRNWIAHGRTSNSNSLEQLLEDLPPLKQESEALLSPLAGPNPPCKLEFDDFIVYSRVVKAIAFDLSRFRIPPPEAWPQKHDTSKLNKLKRNPSRRRQALISAIRSEYGLDLQSAENYAESVLDALA